MQKCHFLRLANIVAILPCLLAVTFFLAGSSQAQGQTSSAAGANQGSASTEGLVRLEGHTALQVLNGTAVRVGHYSPEQKLRLVLAIRPPHMAEEEEFNRGLVAKGSPEFHKFLTSEEWDARFAPSAEDEQKVVDWAQTQGLTVTNRYSHRLIVDIEAPAGVIEKAFGVTIDSYQYRDEVDFANDRDPLLPASLSGIVYSVQGLNNIQREHGSRPGSEKLRGPDYIPGPLVALAGADHGDGEPGKAMNLVKAIGGATPELTNKFIDPSDLYSSQTYNYGGLQNFSHCCNVHNDSTGSPAVSSIAIAGFGDFLGSDISGFAKTYGLSYNWTSYTIAGPLGCSNSSTTPPCATGETTEDVEYSIATSNNPSSSNDTSHVYIYLAGNFNNTTFTTMYSNILNDNSTRVMTTSWSCTEVYDCSDSTMDSRHAIFNKMVGMGWTLIAASGDRGASDDCQDNLPAKPAPQLDPDAHTAVAFPASDFDFVAAGGTQLMLYTDGTWDYEHAWQGGFGIGSCAGNGGGSGGGVSVHYGQPSWQNALKNLGSNRLSPDISLNALGIGQNLYINGVLNGDANGTSVVAPELAGFFAQENTYLNYIGNICGTDGNTACTPVGVPTSFIYDDGIGGAPHDPFYNMLSGCNSNDATKNDNLSSFCAGPGFSFDTSRGTQYNLVSGWGSANMMQLAWGINWELIPAYGNPALSFSGPAKNTWYNSNQTVSWTLKDSGSGGLPAPGVAGFTQGWDSIPEDPYSEPHGGSGNSFYSGPQFPFAKTGCLAFEPNGCSGGVSQGCHTVNVEGWDNEGRTVVGTYGPLCYDTVQPTIGVVDNPASPKPSGWYTAPVTVTLSAADPGGSGASGVSQIYYGLDNSSCETWDTGACATYGSTLTVNGQGTQTLIAFSEDKAGNFSPSYSEALFIDYTPPVTTAGFSGATSGGAWENSITVVLKATDNASGVAVTYYTVDGGSKVQYTGSFKISSVGSHTLDYWSVDVAGNTEKTNSDTFAIASATVTKLTTYPNPSVNGQKVILKATVTAVDPGTPTGTVTFLIGSTALATEHLSGGVAVLYKSALPIGSDGLAVTYNGATNFLASTSEVVTQVVHESTTTTLTATPNPAVFGSTVTLKAQVKPSVSGTPTGHVDFYSGATLLGKASLNSSAAASLTTTALAGGKDSIKAVYAGDITFATSTSAALTEAITKAASDTALKSTGSPSSYDATVTFTATVTSTAGTPTGIVTFFSNGTEIGSGTIVDGVAGFTTKALPVGTNSIKATYGGSGDFGESTSTAVSEVTDAATTATKLASSANPSAFGQLVTFQAIVTPVTAGTPVGAVTFLSNGTSIGTGTLSGGVATFATESLAVGTSSITASYGGSTDYKPSTSPALSQVVDAAATTTVVTSSANPSSFGQAVTFTAKVTCATGKPLGTVTFFVNGKSIGNGSLADNVASVATSALAVGTNTVTATYAGNTAYKTSTSAALSEVTHRTATTAKPVSPTDPSGIQ